MNKNSIFKSLATMVALVAASYASFAGTGTNADPYTVCAASGYKLTASTSISSGTVNASGYRWKDNSGAIISGATSASYEVAAATTPVTSTTTLHYTVEASSGAGCYSDPQDIYVTLIPAPDVTVPTLANACAINTGGTAGTVNLTATSPTPSLPSSVSISWSNWTGAGGTITQGSAGSATVTGLGAAGSYTYSITGSYTGLNVGASACTTIKTTGITIDPIPATPSTTITGL